MSIATPGPPPATVEDAMRIVQAEFEYWNNLDRQDKPTLGAMSIAAVGACANIFSALNGMYAEWHPQPSIGEEPTGEYVGSKRARTLDEWHEDHGFVLWWILPVCEPPYVGCPLSSDWPGYHTHWTPIPLPSDHNRKDGEPCPTSPQ